MTRVAILGARGQIAYGLLENLPQSWTFSLFSRNTCTPFGLAASRGATVQHYKEFASGTYDLVINAAGPGDPSVHRANSRQIMRITEAFDNLILDYIAANPSVGYINLSTGAVYGTDYGSIGDDPVFPLHVNNLAQTNAYALAKIAAETKHRLASELKVADLRIFGYFSHHINPGSGYFMAQVADHLCRRECFVTNAEDFVRDFIAPEDLAAHVVTLYEAGVPNAGFDAVSARPATKFDILEALGDRFGLRYSIEGGEPAWIDSPQTAISADGNVDGPALRSRYRSIDVVLREAEALLAMRTDRG